jgi:hypothetical protein
MHVHFEQWDLFRPSTKTNFIVFAATCHSRQAFVVLPSFRFTVLSAELLAWFERLSDRLLSQSRPGNSLIAISQGFGKTKLLEGFLAIASAETAAPV